MGSGTSTQRPVSTANSGPKGSMNGDVPSTPKTATGQRPASQEPAQYSKAQAPPPPTPPRNNKDEIFKEADFKEVDDYVVNAPGNLMMGNFRELIDYLTKNPEWDDLCKARAIFRWVTSVNVYDLKTEAVPPTHSPLEYFTKIQCNMGNHAHLMSGLCQMAGIPCVIVSGMNKSAAYEIGKKCDRKGMGAQWNAVHVRNDWRFIDAFWASACVVGRKSGEWTLVDSDGNVTKEDDDGNTEGSTQHRINEFYFLPDPDKFIWTHYPDEKQWQLLAKTVTVKEFEEKVYIRERFHYLGMKLVPESETKCMLQSKAGETVLTFSLPPERSGNFRYKYMLYQSRASATDENLDMMLERFVMFEHNPDKLKFTLRFPVKGKFKMDIFGLEVDESDIFDLVCTYVIECKEAKQCLPLPDCPPIGWGPNPNLKDAGLTAKSHDGAVILSEDGTLEIRLSSDKDVNLHQMLKHALIDEATLSNYAVTRLENGEYVVNIRLPEGGEYALKLYSNMKDEDGEAANVLNYLIKCDKSKLNSNPFPNITDGMLGKKPIADILGVKALSHPGHSILAKDGKATVEFEAKNNIELMCELHSTDGGARRLMKAQTKLVNGKWVFDLDMPKSGEYSLNVFAREKGAKGGKDRMYNVHSYLVNSDGRELTEEEQAMAAEGDAGKPKIPVETVQTSDSEVYIPVPKGYEKVVAALHRRNANDPPNPNQVQLVQQDGMNLIKATLNEYGEYMLNLYDTDENGVVTTIAKYQINRKPPDQLFADDTKVIMNSLRPEGGAPVQLTTQAEVPEEAPPEKGETEEEKQRRIAKAQMKKGMQLKDIHTIEQGIAAYEASKPPADDKDSTLGQAKKLLEILRAKEALTEASQKRDLQALEKALAKAKEVNFDGQLDLQIALASRLRDQLARIEKLRHSVLNLDQKTIAELKSYTSPPEGVHQSMMATFLLLGNPMKEVKYDLETKNWRNCQIIMGKTGRESLMRKIGQFDPKDCSLETAGAASKVIEPFTLDQIRDVSAGAATFFGWSKGMIEEIESTGGAGVGTGGASTTTQIRPKTSTRAKTPAGKPQAGRNPPRKAAAKK